ncbi:PRC-barrel domain-containing protein [Marivirga sp. S37H4]|uniref:PRC-barrel domain-containing protein n=1 Tax=Marivirga aurantiaca TaxID=2802615 RepID=A0A935C708_9BACT|nr:PRC-barrel domain-containing protein [Marivirga aurantiaca]MBK6264072.1 PRC-barrel domain-containing protein [Marivirga aurantiaca]
MRNQNNDLILSTSTLEGSKVKNLSDETIGDIKDIMLDAETGEVAYAVLSVNTGFLNLESKYFAIPWQVFSFNTVDEVLVLDIDKERLKNSPGFDKDNWPTGPQTEFINEINTYYGVETNRMGRAEPEHRTPR